MTEQTPAPAESTLQKVFDGFTKAVNALPTALNLAANTANQVTKLVSDFKELASNPDVTQAEIDALVDQVSAQSAEIQSIK